MKILVDEAEHVPQIGPCRSRRAIFSFSRRRVLKYQIPGATKPRELFQTALVRHVETVCRKRQTSRLRCHAPAHVAPALVETRLRRALLEVGRQLRRVVTEDEVESETVQIRLFFSVSEV